MTVGVKDIVVMKDMIRMDECSELGIVNSSLLCLVSNA